VAGLIGRSVTLTLSGEPAINTPKSAARDVQQAVNNIRERLKGLEVQVNAHLGVIEGTAAGTSSANADLTTLKQQVHQLQVDLAAAQAAIATLDAEVPTDVFVNGLFIGTRHILNFIQGGGLRITGTDNTAQNRADILFEALVDLALFATRSVLKIRGHEIGLNLGKQLGLVRSQLRIRGRSITMVIGAGLVYKIN